MRLAKSAVEMADDETSKAVRKLWDSLVREKEGSVAVGTLEAVVAAILNIQLINATLEEKPVPSRDLTSPPEDRTIAAQEPAKTLSNEEIQRLHKDFSLLYLNRKSNGPSRPNIQSDRVYKFKPEICQESVRLAETGREKYTKRDNAPEDEAKKAGEAQDGNKLASLADALFIQKRNQEE